MDETEEQDVEVKEVEEPLPDIEVPVPVKDPSGNNDVVVKNDIKNEIEDYKKTTDFTAPSKLSFSNDDTMVDIKGNTSIVNSPKDDKNLEELEKARALKEAEAEDDEDDDEDERLTIGENVTLDIIDINDLNKAAAKVELKPPVLDFEILT